MKLTPTGLMSTASNALLGRTDEFSKHLLRYRELKKLTGTYLEPILDNIKDGRLYSMFNQGVTITGRLSSSNPINLQNIPSRTIDGKKIRSIFIKPENGSLLDIDYSQIELRLLAHFSNDSIMVDAFNKNKDLHLETAKVIFNKFEPSKEERFIAKTINFACLYGCYPKRIMQIINTSGTGITVTFLEASNILNRFNELYREAEIWKKMVIAKASMEGKITTLLGRVIPIEGLKSEEWKIKSMAEREVISYIIQGSAADIMKKAMISLTKEIPDLRLTCTVHDELLIEKTEDSTNIVPIMENCVQLKVPLIVDSKLINNWSEK